jgi:hypothetical protein
MQNTPDIPQTAALPPVVVPREELTDIYKILQRCQRQSMNNPILKHETKRGIKLIRDRMDATLTIDEEGNYFRVSLLDQYNAIVGVSL